MDNRVAHLFDLNDEQHIVVGQILVKYLQAFSVYNTKSMPRIKQFGFEINVSRL